MDFVASLMLSAGVLGGGAYCFLNHHPKYPDALPGERTGAGKLTPGGIFEWLWQLLVSVVLGITAASVVPVFLHATSSNLINEVREFEASQNAGKPAGGGTPSGQAPKPGNGNSSAPYVFFGFCVLAAYAAQRFLQAMLNRLLREIEEQKVRTKQALAAAEDARRIAISTENTLTARLAGVTPVVATPRLSDEEKRVLNVLVRSARDHGRKSVTAAGISSDSGLSAAIAQTTLDGLSAKGLVNVHDHAGQREWGLTEAGAQWRP